MSNVVKFKRIDKEGVDKYRLLNSLKVVQKSIKQGSTDTLAVVWLCEGGQVGYLYQGPRVGELISGLEVIKLRILSDINAI